MRLPCRTFIRAGCSLDGMLLLRPVPGPVPPQMKANHVRARTGPNAFLGAPGSGKILGKTPVASCRRDGCETSDGNRRWCGREERCGVGDPLGVPAPRAGTSSPWEGRPFVCFLKTVLWPYSVALDAGLVIRPDNCMAADFGAAAAISPPRRLGPSPLVAIHHVN